MNRPKKFLSALALCLATASVSAHVPFLKPNQFNVLHKRLQIESSFTEYPFQADFAMDSPGFSIVLPDGTQQALKPTGKTTAATYLEPSLPVDGTYRISTGVRKGPLYKALETNGKLYFADDMKRVTGRNTSMQYYSRADTYIAKGEPAYAPGPANAGVAIVPFASPNQLVAGNSLQLKVFKDGKPAPHARVVVVADGEHYVKRRAEDLYDVDNVRPGNLHADGEGIVTFRPSHAGLHLLFVTIHDRLSDDMWESHNGSLTLEVGLPAH